MASSYTQHHQYQQMQRQTSLQDYPWAQMDTSRAGDPHQPHGVDPARAILATSNASSSRVAAEHANLDQIRQQRFVTSRKTAANRAQRLLSASRSNKQESHSLSNSAVRPTHAPSLAQSQNQGITKKRGGLVQQKLASRFSHEHFPEDSSPHTFQPTNQNQSQHNSAFVSALSSIDHNNIASADGGSRHQRPQLERNMSPHGNPLLSGPSSKQTSVRQSLTFSSSTMRANEGVQLPSSGATSNIQPQQEATSGRFVGRNANYNMMGDKRDPSDSVTNPLTTSLNNVLATSSQSLDSFTAINGATSNQSLPPLSRQLLQRRNQGSLQQTENSTSIGSRNTNNKLQPYSKDHRTRETLIKIGQGVTSQANSTNKLQLSSKRSLLGRHAADHDSNPNTQSQSLMSGQKNRLSQRGLQNINLGTYQSSTSVAQNQIHRLQQRIPSFRKRRNEHNTEDSASSGGANSTSQNNLKAKVKRTLQMSSDTPIQPVKSRVTLGSAAVESRRNSTKKIRYSGASSRKVTQSNFHTIPVKENSSLPTPQDSVCKQSRFADQTTITCSSQAFNESSKQPLSEAKSHSHRSVEYRFAGAQPLPPSQRFLAPSQDQLLISNQSAVSGTSRYSICTAGSIPVNQLSEQGRMVRPDRLKESKNQKQQLLATSQTIDPTQYRYATSESTQRPAIAHKQVEARVMAGENSTGRPSNCSHRLTNESVQTSQHQPARVMSSDTTSLLPPSMPQLPTDGEMTHSSNVTSNVTPVTQVGQKCAPAPTLLVYQDIQQFSKDSMAGSINMTAAKPSFNPNLNNPNFMMPNTLQARASHGTRNAPQVAGLGKHNSHGVPKSERVPVEFSVGERRADSRPRAGRPTQEGGAGPGSAQRFKLMRQRLYQPSFKQQEHQAQPPNGNLNLSNSFALETTSIEINESLGNPAILGSAQQQRTFTEQDSLNQRTMLDSEKTVVKEMHGVSRLINEMSYIQNVSSNENLLSPNMFSNNSLSPMNPQLLEHPISFINQSMVDPVSPNGMPQGEPKLYSSLERSIQNVVVQPDQRQVQDFSRDKQVRKIRRNFISRKLSGPASRLFPPGFFADVKSCDSGRSPNKMSVDSGAEHGLTERHASINQQTYRSQPGVKPPELTHKSVSMKQSAALERAKALVQFQKRNKEQLNATLSPTRCALQIKNYPSTDEPPSGSLHAFQEKRRAVAVPQNVQTMRIETKDQSMVSSVGTDSRDVDPLGNFGLTGFQYDGLNVPMQTTGHSGALGRKASQEMLPNIGEVDYAPREQPSKTACVSKMQSYQPIRVEQSATRMSRQTDDTFSDLVQKHMKQESCVNVQGSHCSSALAIKEKNRRAHQAPDAQQKQTGTSQRIKSPRKQRIGSPRKSEKGSLQAPDGGAPHFAKQTVQKGQAYHQLSNKIFKTAAWQKRKQASHEANQSNLTIQDTSMGVLSQSTAAASSGAKFKVSSSLRQANLLKQPQQYKGKDQGEKGDKLQRIEARQSFQSQTQQTVLEQSTTAVASPPNKFTNAKAPPDLNINLIENRRISSHISSPRGDFTPYMAGLLSPNNEMQGSNNPASPTDLRSCDASKVKVVSFGQSRCDSSQKGGHGALVNASLGGAEGIMTFGNFASLIEEHQLGQTEESTSQAHLQTLITDQSDSLGVDNDRAQ